MRSSGLHSVPTTPGASGFSAQGRQAHSRLSKLRAWKLPKSFGRRCRTCDHSPAMQPAVRSKQPGKGGVGSQPACSHAVLATLQPSERSKQPGKGSVGSQPACSQPVLATLQVSERSKQPGKGSVGSQPACSQPVS